MHPSQDHAPVYERISDYLFNMSALTRREARQQWRSAIKECWGNRCAYCGATPIVDESLTDLTIDHVRPKSSGGEDRTSNCIPACQKCNQDKSSQEWVAWFRMQPFYTIESEWRIRQWLSRGISHFGPYDEEDSKIVDDYANKIMGQWPQG
jgi:hypothetical protein